MPMPQELVDGIVENLEGDTLSLKCCSLAARTFVTPSQRQLFRKIEIVPPSGIGDNPCQRLYDTLVKSPHLAELIVELRIVLMNDETSVEYEDGDLADGHCPQWILSDEALSLPLSLTLPFLKLKGISLVEDSIQESNDGGRFSMHWNTLGGALKSALADVLSSPTLESVRLRGIVFDCPRDLLSLFSGAMSMKSLTLSRIYFDSPSESHEAWPEAQTWSPRLTCLVLAAMEGDEFVEFFLNPAIDLSQITSFTVATGAKKVTSDIIAAVSSHNRVEHMAVFYIHTPLIKSLSTSQLRSLHFFTLDMCQTISDIFTEYPADSSLQVVTVDCRVRHTPASLNDVVEAGLVRLPLLKRLQIRAVHMDYPEEFPDWADHVRTALPSLEGRGWLGISLLEDDAWFADWE
ncbi:hypothetical protein FB45DRAFT_946951 [Roridomyces roridus]|uniref:Uncharacterized protein n=1 Tax=Roridomyces roridus TaxID=1738132 RepID=A0AAD7FAF7_9AGAR|nr:hypothetical protein FB45DRAFT_946951 [Roridomyces roridus]